MSDNISPDDKPFDATPRKLQKAREKGDIARSADLAVAASYFGFLTICLTVGAVSLSKLGSVLAGILSKSHVLANQGFSERGSVVFGQIFRQITLPAAAWLIGPAVFVLATILAQRSFVVTPSKLNWRASRINPIKNAQNKYGRSGLFEFAKSATKLVIYCLCLWVFLQAHAAEILFSVHLTERQSIALMFDLVVKMLIAVATIAFVIGTIDYLWQQAQLQRRNRMTHKEMMDESKDAEGDPHFKQKRRQKALEIANSQMMANVPTADVIVVNPTHYAVALKWHRNKQNAPSCVAKGTDQVAQRIRALAQENGVPIHSDPPVARALHAELNLGDEIPTQHYQAVAAAIRFADQMRKRNWRAR
ncbi:EscU/YscU/HrcU family type III secretion system export apparatus switch protein [Cognatishimia sp. WU-CL00825]|uniref:EscU/YscU/HrcU family type III secretion system export apparatus switch protein n=1 Tax=Cognatishimia sp. WU-CL00825 TaxID=3127658 RepID=UPI003109D57B